MEYVWLRGKQAGHPRKLSKYEWAIISLQQTVKHSLVQTVVATQGR